MSNFAKHLHKTRLAKYLQERKDLREATKGTLRSDSHKRPNGQKKRMPDEIIYVQLNNSSHSVVLPAEGSMGSASPSGPRVMAAVEVVVVVVVVGWREAAERGDSPLLEMGGLGNSCCSWVFMWDCKPGMFCRPWKDEKETELEQAVCSWDIICDCKPGMFCRSWKYEKGTKRIWTADLQLGHRVWPKFCRPWKDKKRKQNFNRRLQLRHHLWLQARYAL